MTDGDDARRNNLMRLVESLDGRQLIMLRQVLEDIDPGRGDEAMRRWRERNR